jgi:hypothetical protein
MPRMNDNDHTELNLTKVNLKEVEYTTGTSIGLKFALNEVTVSTVLNYDSSNSARDDYQMLIDMLNASEGTKKLLNETFTGTYSQYE